MTNASNKKTMIKSGNITIIIAIFIVMFVYHFISNAIVLNLTEALTEIAVQGSKAVENELKGRLDVVETIALGNTITDPGIPIDKKLEKLKGDVERKNLVMMAISNKYGDSITTDGDRPFVGDRDYFKKAITGKKNISDPIRSRIDDALVISYAVPIVFDEKIIGVLYSIEDIDSLSSVTDTVKLGDFGESFILDRQCTIIAHKQRKMVSDRINPIKQLKDDPDKKSKYRFFENLKYSKKGGDQYLEDSSLIYAGYSKIEGTDWTLVITAPKDKAFRSIDRIYNSVLFVLLVGLVAFFVIQIYIKQLRDDLKSEKIFSDIVIDTANLLILCIDLEGRFHRFNKYAESKLGYSTDIIKEGIKLEDIVDPNFFHKYVEFMEKIFDGESIGSFELPLINNDNETVHAFWNVSVLCENNTETMNMIGIDLSEKAQLAKELEQKHDELSSLYEELYASEETLSHQYDELLKNQETIHKLAYYDSLTGLPNRLLLEDLFNKNIKGTDSISALLLMDIDNFKYVNDALGHDAGDSLLMKVGERVECILGEKCWASRLGGDEFMIMAKGFYSHGEINSYAKNVLKTIESGFYIEDMPINISCSMGIAVYPEHGEEFGDLLKSADAAMYVAKEMGKRDFVLFDKKMNDEILRNLTMVNDIKEAMENNEYFLHYQPQLDIFTGEIRGFEALIRWISPKHGYIPPLDFISIAESSGMILPLGKWVIEEACDFIKRMERLGFKDMKVAVNVSVLQFIQDDFIDIIIGILESRELEASCLELEITETILMEFSEMNMQKINKLSSLGITISIDDFGTGYSSLTYLREISIDILKIDKSFIDEIELGSDKMSIVESIISLGHGLGLKVIAEGVETQEQLDYISYYKCDIAQGYFLGKPMSEEDAIKFLF